MVEGATPTPTYFHFSAGTVSAILSIAEFNTSIPATVKINSHKKSATVSWILIAR